MKKLILLLLIGCFSLFGYSENPIKPIKKSDATGKTVSSPGSVAQDQCSGSTSMVPVTVEVTITDCPDYDCSLPGPTCTQQLCIYEESYDCSAQPLSCTTFYPDTCSYRIEVRAEEGHTLYSKLVVTGCTNHWNNACIQCNPDVPLGGGTVYCGRDFCP